jgi:hypothetical protein
MAAAILLFVSGGTLGPAKAQVIETYRAFLGSADHFNSRGVRLTEPWQIIRQDRANYHRFNVRDPGDQSDVFFDSIANRARMEQLIQSGHIEPSAGRRIINGNVWIRVDIYQNSVNVTVE